MEDGRAAPFKGGNARVRSSRRDKGKRLSESACWTGSTRGSRRARATERNAWSRGARPRRGAPRRDPSHTPAKIRRRFDSPTGTEVPTKVPLSRAPTRPLPPFDFRCGFVGYLGYEMRAECDSPAPRHHSPVPDAALYFADRVVAVDHSNDDGLLALVPDEIDIAGLERDLSRRRTPRRGARWRRGWWRWPERRRRGTRVRGWRRRNGPCLRWGASTRRGAIHRRTKRRRPTEKRFDTRGSDGGDWRASGRRAGRVRAHAPRGSHSRSGEDPKDAEPPTRTRAGSRSAVTGTNTSATYPRANAPSTAGRRTRCA